MSLRDIVTKEAAIQLRSARRHATYDGRHEWRRNESSARRTHQPLGSYKSPVTGVHGNTALQLEEIEGIATYEDPAVSADEVDTLYRTLNQTAPGLFQRHLLTDVLQLVKKYGKEAVIEGYHASLITGLPFAQEVMISSSQPYNRADAIDPEIDRIFAQAQNILSPDVKRVSNQPPRHRNDISRSSHYLEHAFEHRLDPR